MIASTTFKNPIDVSVCIVTYNHADFINKCLDSVLHQETNFQFEILIHDDCSTDETSAIILDYTSKYPELIKPIIQETNVWNTKKGGIRINPIYNFPRAQGKYIALLDGDDYWTDELKLQKQVNFLDLNSDYSACTHKTLILKNEDDLQAHRVSYKDEYSLNDLISKYSLFHSSSFLFRRNLLDLPDWFQTVSSGDLALFAILANKGPIKFLSNINPSVYRKHASGITNNPIHTGVRFHLNRIEMLTLFKVNLNNINCLKLDLVIAQHIQNIILLSRKDDSIRHFQIFYLILKYITVLPPSSIFRFIKYRIMILLSKFNS